MPPGNWRGTDLLGDARRWLAARAQEPAGGECPCCGQRVKVYKRPLNSGMARSLIAMYRAAGTDWQHIPTTVGSRSREEGKLRYWGLVEESFDRREDGGRAGWWRVTEEGVRFVRRISQVPKYVLVYNGRMLRLDDSDGLISIDDALGTQFSYEELMSTEGRVDPE